VVSKGRSWAATMEVSEQPTATASSRYAYLAAAIDGGFIYSHLTRWL